MKEFWINERTGSASLAEESISYGYHTHVIEYEALESLQEENAELKAQLKIATEALNEIKFAALQGDETFSEINCYHLASDCLLKLETTGE